ncbi:putative receptor-like protein kinase At4g00960 [Benincasa hispida]|uniref:putative receptor-like protein kinase At4g00960 n=1 Tax=Benincasa hispida TaxID=102211 RepID=UPI00190206AC|nr:putative receptor-like protein kinase At4g00960 [Benincasa hispida]
MVWLRLKDCPSLYLGFLIFFILICQRNHMAIAQQDLGWVCDVAEGNYTNNSTYKANLNNLLSTLTTHQIDYGFYNFSYGHDHKAYAIGLCRGGVAPQSCKTCLNNSITLLSQNCPTQIEAVVWFEDCMLRYSDRSLFGVMDLRPTRYVVLPSNASDPRFTELATDLLIKLTPEAASGDSRLKYATGKAQVPNFPVIYGDVQCTPDLPSNDCTDCLLGVIAQVRPVYYEAPRVRILNPSCSIRFDFNRTFQDPRTSITSPSLSSNTTSSSQGNRTRRLVFIFVPIIVVAVVAALLLIIIILRARNSPKNGSPNVESLQFDFDTIRVATDGFSDENQLGRGGFGAVYKGRLPDGQNIAVKRLFQGSNERDDEFKNEIVLVAKLQHRNLVQLLGFCFNRNEKLLIYEFVENSSLEKFLFNPIKREILDWKTRYNIIEGIVRGLIYLHEDSQLRIIHRDLKASNILLDAEMNAKISDFGTAKLFMHDQTQGDTRKIIGTYGYMAPEYAWNGQFSIKLDVFSFGILVLEIVTGQKNNRAQTNKEIVETLVNYAWRNWQSGNALDIVDPCLKSGSKIEMARCIHIGLLCVQENPLERPTMTTVLLMLNSGSITLPRPSQPAFFINSTCSQMSPQFEDHSSTHDSNELSITELYPR